MGQSTDAILAFGVDFGEEIPDQLWEWAGVEREYGDTYPLDKALKKHGLELVRHCSSEAPMYVLAVEGSVTTAWRGSPKVMTDFNVPQAWLDTWSHWKDISGAPAPTWLLFSDWG